MNLKNILLRLSTAKIYKHISVVVFVLFMISTVVLSGFAALTAKAVTWNGVSATPSSCNVGDTITVSVTGGVNINEYRYGYRIDNTGDYIIYQEWTSSPTSTFIPSTSGSYSFIVYCRDGSSSSSAVTFPVVVSGSESSAESSAESSEPESSDPESSFDPMNWMPSNWLGNDYIQPSADSTPDLSYEELPSDLNEFWVSENLADIIVRAFKAFPAKLIVLMIPTIICLFVAWWLHK